MNAEPNFYCNWPTSAVDELTRLNRLANAAHAVSDTDDIIGERDGLAHFIAQAIRGLDTLSPQEALARLRELDYHAGYMVNAPSEPPLPPPPECMILSAVELPPLPLEALYWGAVAAYDAALHTHGDDSPQCRQKAAQAKALGRLVRAQEGAG